MGIDIYAASDGMSGDDERAQITGFSVLHGHVGYLREAYHGDPYATRILVPEAFEADAPEIPAAKLRERLPAALEAAEERERVLYGETDAEAIERVLTSYRNFVELCERKERETGKPCRIQASW
jgi:hypothetical protein